MPSLASYKLRRQEARTYYKSIGVFDCPAFKNEKVYFQNAGFKHLIYREKRFRPIPDQLRRFKALFHVKDILLQGEKFSEYREEKGDLTTAHFWAFEKEINQKTVTVIIRRINMGPLHFFSVRSQ